MYPGHAKYLLLNRRIGLTLSYCVISPEARDTTHQTMKNVYLLLGVVSILLFSSCSVTFQNVVKRDNFANENLELRLKSENYRIVRTVTGEARATYICSFGGLSPKAQRIFASSYDDMVTNANLQPNQAIINVSAEKRANLWAYGIFARQVVHTTGTIIEFISSTDKVSQPNLLTSHDNTSTITPTDSLTTQRQNRKKSKSKSDSKKKTAEKVEKAEKVKPIATQYTSLPVNIGDLYTINGITGIVVETYNQGMNGKIIYNNRYFFNTWDTANSNCRQLGNSWRLPNKSEMASILKQAKQLNASIAKLDKFPKISKNEYWTSDINNQGVLVAYIWDGDIAYDYLTRTEIVKYIAIAEF